MGRGAFSSQPTQKTKPCLLPESDTTDPLVPKASRNRHGRRTLSSEPRECTVEHVHEGLLPPLDEAKPRLAAGVTLHLRVATYGDSPTCAGVPAHNRHHVMTEGNRSLIPVRAPSPASAPHPPPFFDDELVTSPSNSSKSQFLHHTQRYQRSQYVFEKYEQWEQG
jgi:hypothetical protein